jgi:hypothetical protein
MNGKRRLLGSFWHGSVSNAMAQTIGAQPAFPAAAPSSALNLLFRGAGAFVIPITLIYTFAVYFIFRGKVNASAELPLTRVTGAESRRPQIDGPREITPDQLEKTDGKFRYHHSDVAQGSVGR